MPRWQTLFVTIIGVVALWWCLFEWQVFGRNKTRHDLEHWMKSLLLLRANRGFLTIQHRKSPFFLRFYRESGNGSHATGLLSVPRTAWSEAKLVALCQLYDRQGLPYVSEKSGLRYESSLFEARVQLPDIWDDAVGAAPARMAHLILDLWGLAPEERFDLTLHGPRSRRLFDHYRGKQS